MDTDVWLVHATDPHLFEEPSKEAKPRKKSLEELSRRTQEEGNREAFLALLKTLGSLPNTGGRADYLVITGDFGFGEDEFSAAPAAAPAAAQAPAAGQAQAPAEGQAPAAGQTQAASGSTSPSPPAEVEPAAQCSTDTRAGRMKCLIDVLATSPLREVYVVPGNNDVEDEKPGDLARAHSFFAKVQEKQSKVMIHDLTRCYVGNAPRSQCWADVPGTSFRLVGFPSHSFKNKVDQDDAGAIRVDRRKDNQTLQEAQMKLFGELIQEAGRAGRKVLVVTHIAEMDDPYWRAQGRFTKQSPVPAGYDTWQQWSAWNVSKELQQKWNGLIRSSTVAGVLAGHFHDSHRETYRWPRAWASSGFNRAPLEKVMLAPPLAVRLQHGSPFQARGFALIGLRGEEMTRRLVWYDPVRKRFDAERTPTRERRWVGVPAVATWYWNVAGEAGDLSRAAVVAIAFLAAVLTIVRLWEIPVAKTPLATPGVSNPPPPNDDSGAGGLQGNFGKTVLAGLGGMLALSFLDSIWSDKGFDSKAYYILLFVSFFFPMLLVYALLQGMLEGLRSRILTQPPVPAWRPWNSGPQQVPNGGGAGPAGGGAAGGGPAGGGPAHGGFAAGPQDGESGGVPARSSIRFAMWLSYWRGRIWHWILSLRVFFLILFDTAFNVIRGRNQSKTVVFEEAIVALHWCIVRAADRMREEIERAILEILGSQAGDEDIRVSVSVLSDDGSVLYYIARERGSLARGFDRRSVAWVSVYASVARWWRKDYPTDTELFDNSSGGLALLPAGKIRLSEYYQQRQGSDYEAFIVLPVPWANRGASEVVRKAGIQISFRNADHMKKLFHGIESTAHDTNERSVHEPNYEFWPKLLDPLSEKQSLVHPALRSVLHQAISVLEELLIPFNENVFDLLIRPNLRVR